MATHIISRLHPHTPQITYATSSIYGIGTRFLLLTWLAILHLQAAATALAATTPTITAGVIVNEFVDPHASEIPTINSTFQHIVVNEETGDVYVGSVNHVYRLDEHLTLQSQARTGPVTDRPFCTYECNIERLNNFNKILLIDYSAEQLLTCGSTVTNSCYFRDLLNVSDSRSPQRSNDFSSLVAGKQGVSCVAFIAPGPVDDGFQSNVLYVAVSGFSGRAVKYGVPTLVRRNLTNLSFPNTLHEGGPYKLFEDSIHDKYGIRYVYGFSSEGFSYFIVQMKATEQSGFHTAIIRLCQNDNKFNSYAELVLKCNGTDGTDYNIIQNAYLGHPGRSLALSMGLNLRSDVLFAVFSNGEKLLDKPTGKSAVCMFSVDRMNQVLFDSIKTCFQGKGFYGGHHLNGYKPCENNQMFTIEKDYCGQAGSNSPFVADTPVVADALVEFSEPSPVLSSISVDVTHDYTVAFVGTADGRLIKISMDSNTSANVYDTITLAPGKYIKGDQRFATDDQHIFVLTNKTVLKVKMQNCDRYKTCYECLNAMDPYCGWCSMENKCSQRKDCQASDLPQRWLSYTTDTCPHIRRVHPPQVQRNKARLLTMDIQNLPDFQTGATYQCKFAQNNSASSVQVPDYTSRANRTNRNTFQCYTPPLDKLPPFNTGDDSVTMSLALIVNGQKLVSDSLVFFDCGIHTSCSACASSHRPCSWCINRHLCTDNPDKHCNTDINVLGEHIPRISPDGLQGPQKCPRFDIPSQGTEILVGAGSSLAVQVTALALQQSLHLSDVRCEFVLDDVKEVPATVSMLNGVDEYEITCQSVMFNYIREVDLQRVSFRILWGGAKNMLDNPEGIIVVMYKCGVMAPTCGDCLTIHSKYNCGWCDNRRCSTQNFCQGTVNGFLRKGAVCRNPKILKITPMSGPLKGGTLLTIQGQNLGTSKDEASVNIDIINCDIISFTAPNKIVCRTQSSFMVMSKPVSVVIGQGRGNRVKAESKEYFSFVQPKVTSIWPTVGVYAGGTTVTLLGDYLDAGSDVSVFIGQNPCTNVVSVNSSALTCKTSAASGFGNVALGITLKMDNEEIRPSGLSFQYAKNPNITMLSRHEVIKSGGLHINVSGENFQNVQSPKILLWYKNVPYSEACVLNPRAPSSNMTCMSPNITGIQADDFVTYGTKSASSSGGSGYIEVDIGFKMDDVESLVRATHLGKMRVYTDPVVKPFSGGEKQLQPGQEILIIDVDHLDPLRGSDVQITIGQEECLVKSVAAHIITCEPPQSKPAAMLSNSDFPEVVLTIGKDRYELGVLRYENQEEISQEQTVIIVAAVIFFILVLLAICIVCLIKFRRNDDMMKKMRKEMDQLESRVANECKEAFAELQTDMSELTSDLSGGGSIPFWDYRTYCMRVLFPPECNDHPVIRELELDYHHREDTERGLQLFFNLVRNKTFLLSFIRTLESNHDFHLRDRVNVASLISVTLQTQMEYATEILKTLLAELIEKTVENPKQHAKLLLRRNESVAEKMLTNWFTFLLYKFLKECAGEPLFMLHGAIKQQVSKGPVDCETGEARYSLSEDKLIRQHINYRSMVLHVMDVDVDRCSQAAHPVKVLDCDTISQVKEKILDAIYKSAPFSSRPPKKELDLVLFDHPAEWCVGNNEEIPMKMFPNNKTKRLVLSDEDHTSKMEGDFKRLNTLSHYQVPDGAYVALHPKQTSIYNMSIVSEKSKFSENSFYNRSPTLNRSHTPQNGSMDVESCKTYHLVRPQDESNTKEGDRGNKMVTEIYLPRLLVTKGTLQTFVDDLFERIFSTTHRGIVMPLAIKYMFDFLDDQAMLHSMGDDVVHTWKSNSLPLRFWVNVIKNPDFAFDIHKSNIVDACLTVIGQTFMDCCSTLEHKLTKESPSGKLLYAKDIPKYKQWVASYYQDIKMMPAISDQDMTAMLAEESRAHHSEFNTNAALLELWKYVKKYYDDILNALEDDEFAKKSKLTYKLEQVSAALDGNAVC